MKVLIIEDDERLLELYETFQEGFENSAHIDIVKTGTQALEYLKEKVPDIILIDLFMPDMNGIEILKYLHQSEKIKKTKAYILTNLTEDSLQKQALDMGAEGYIIKSNISFQMMKDLIEKGVFKSE